MLRSMPLAKEVAKRDDRNVNDRIFEKFQELAKNSMPGDRESFEARLNAERARLQGLAAQAQGETRKKLNQDIERLSGVMTDFEIHAPKNYETAATEGAQADREEREQQKRDREVAHLMALEDAKKTEKMIADQNLDFQIEDAQSPSAKIDLLREKETRLRTDRNNHKYTTVDFDPLTASPEEYSEAAKGASDDGTRDKMLAEAKELQAIQREINRLTEENEKQIEDVCTAEAEHTALVDKTRKTMAGEREILEALAAGQYDVAAAATRRQQIEEQIDKLVKEGIPQAEAKAIAEQNAALKLETTRAQIRRDLEEEHAITQAQVAGETQLVELLERQRALRQQTEALEKEGLTATEARAAATRAANDQQGLKDSARNQALDQTRADLGVDSARTAGQRQRAEIEKLRTDSYYELKGKGLKDEDINEIIGERMDNYRRQNRGKTIGGPTTRAAGDHLGDRMSDKDFDNLFKPQGITAPDGSDLDQRPGGASASPFDRSLGKTSDTDWNKIFNHGIAPLVPEPSNRPDEPAGGASAGPDAVDTDGTQNKNAPANKAADNLSGAADTLKKGGTDMSSTGQKLNSAAETIKSGIQSLSSAANGIQQLGPLITEAVNNLQQQINDLQSQIQDLQNS